MKELYQIDMASENSLLLRFNIEPNDNLLAILAQLQHELKLKLANNLIDSIASYNTLLIQYDALKVDHFYVKKVTGNALATVLAEDVKMTANTVIRLPVWYDTDNYFDFLEVCKHTNLSPEQLIQHHCSITYKVYATGFAPGFAFLGQLSSCLQTPRKQTPRKSVPKGAVAIAHTQTAVYPELTPGGWNIIGRCPVELNPVLPQCSVNFKIGDAVQFFPIDEMTYREQIMWRE